MLAEFSRVMWASRHAREVWEPRVSAVATAWLAAERASVQVGLRPACLQAVAPEQLPALAAKASALGLVALPLAQQGASASYGNAEQPMAPGQTWEYRVVVCQPHVAEFIAAAWTSDRRDEEVGTLLGFTPCCRAFFQRVWVEQGLRDTTWHMNHQQGRPEANILLRWVGVRLVPHLPCGFSCTETERQGRTFAELLPAQERAWAYELLSWPMRWTARHGIAELETPCFKINMTTDVCHEFRELRREGVVPPDGATGVRFPYDAPAAKPVVNRLTVIDPHAWTDNGFPSQAAMDEAHAMVMGAVGDATGFALDLGSGNGYLLGRFVQGGIGVEQDADRAARGRRAGHDVRCGRIQDVSHVVGNAEWFDVALISARRLDEMSSGETECLRAWLAEHVAAVCLYSYDSPRFARMLKPAHLPVEAVA